MGGAALGLDVRGLDAGLLEEAEGGVGGLGAPGEPVSGALDVDLQRLCGLLLRVVVADLLDAVTRALRPAVGDDHPVVRVVERAHAHQADLYLAFVVPFAARRRGWAPRPWPPWGRPPH